MFSQSNNWAQDASAYWVDAAQRSILFLDAMRKRGNLYLEHRKAGKPPVLTFDYDMIVDGRKLERPVNYALLRIRPDADAPTDPKKRPMVVFDPRAGHGPGIGGFKPDSQVGVALKSGHPCYFVTFFPDPEPGQTLEDVAVAEAHFLHKVVELQPEAEGKPIIVGNCQAGWAVMMLNAVVPGLASAITIAGAPLSYWAGSGEQNPMRYLGGLFGGSWLASLASDLGNGRFDGAYLVENFEKLNPSNTYWSKQYNLYSKIDSEEERYLDFERWWGGFFTLNAEEIQFIVDQLFVGNKLGRGGIVTTRGERIDLKKIGVPIVVFASWGDNITPPQQALQWIVDVYGSVDEICAHDQVIIYLLHEKVGHLGIFVSGSIAKKEYAKLNSVADMIDVLPPGLYEMVIEEKKPGEPGADLIEGDYTARFEARDIDDIIALGSKPGEQQDSQLFQTVARISEINTGLYQTFLGPLVDAWTNDGTAEFLRETHPLRMQRSVLSDLNPFMWPVKMMAETVRENRQKVAEDNPFFAMQEMVSDQIVKSLDLYRDTRDRTTQAWFESFYGMPLMEALVGLRAPYAEREDRRVREQEHRALLDQKLAAIKARAKEGGLAAAIIRIGLYFAKRRKYLDVRGFRMLMQISESHPELRSIPWDEFREIVRNQFFLVVFDEEVAAETLPDLVPTMEERRLAVDIVEKAGQAVRPPSAEEKAELDQIRRFLGVTVTAAPEPAPVEAASVTPLHKETPPAEEPQAAGRSAHAARAARPAARSGAAKATTRTRKPKAGTASRSKA